MKRIPKQKGNSSFKITPRITHIPDKGIMRDEISCSLPGMKYKGTLRSFSQIIIRGAVWGLLAYFTFRNVKDRLDLKKLKAKNDEALRIIEAKHRIFKISKQDDVVVPSIEDIAQDEIGTKELISWSEYFDMKFPKELLDLPPIITEFCVDCPWGYEPAVIAELTALLAICFSKVKAKYLDSSYHRANLQVVIEGESGSGKGAFKKIYSCLFERIISLDMDKLNSEKPDECIIQTLSSSVTTSRLMDILANNQDVHAIMVESEVRTLIDAMKRSNGFSYDLLRKAYDNDTTGRLNKNKNSLQGPFPVALNIVLTGTPGDLNEFIKPKAVEGGNANRIAWCTIPPAGRDIPQFKMPEGSVLNSFQDRIEEWSAKYSFYSDEDGKDIPANELVIDLEYVNKELLKWLDYQYEKSRKENNKERERVRGRMASMAFHCAIIYHMLFDNPTPNCHKKRDDVVKLTLYMANYFIERYLHKFSAIQNELHEKINASELVSVPRGKSEQEEDQKPTLPKDPKEKGKLLYELHETQQLSYHNLAVMFGVSKDVISGSIRRYRKELDSESKD